MTISAKKNGLSSYLADLRSDLVLNGRKGSSAEKFQQAPKEGLHNYA
jgi:hypothetical protein